MAALFEDRGAGHRAFAVAAHHGQGSVRCRGGAECAGVRMLTAFGRWPVSNSLPWRTSNTVSVRLAASTRSMLATARPVSAMPRTRQTSSPASCSSPTSRHWRTRSIRSWSSSSTKTSVAIGFDEPAEPAREDGSELDRERTGDVAGGEIEQSVVHRRPERPARGREQSHRPSARLSEGRCP